jgi:FixJ family two-component response regulator
MIATQVQRQGTGMPIKPAPMPAVVFVVVDDISVRESLESLILSAGWQPITFACAQEFLVHPPLPAPSCLVLDVSLPDISGLELQKLAAAERAHTPLIFVAHDGDVPTAVRAMKNGAVDFLTKPFDAAQLLEGLGDALDRSRAMMLHEAEMAAIRERHAALTRREREVMALVVSGLLNKQVAGELGIAEITVKAHRGNVMRKMAARSLPDLVRIAVALRAGKVVAS